MPRERSKDRRVQKTRGLLHEAIASLIHEKSYDDIVVKEILARANVGRSTFYTHYRDKDELLDSGLRDMLRACASSAAHAPGSVDRILGFSRPLFAHLEQYRRASRGAVDVQRQAGVHARLEQALAELVADDLRRMGGRTADRGESVPHELLARHVAATLVLVLDWWMESDASLPATRANDLFRILATPALAAALV
jgi:AcrR family transcriptional regulator